VIEDAYRLGEGLGLAAWCADQAGPSRTAPDPERAWRPAGAPARSPDEYLRGGTAEVLTLFHPADGRVRLHGVTSCPNAALYPWLKRELTAILAGMPGPDPAVEGASRRSWERWQDGLTIKPTPLPELPPLRMPPVLDDLAGHKTPAFECRLSEDGIMPLYTPVGGTWLNMAESIQRVLKRRALAGRHPSDTDQILAWFEAVARHWNAAPTPFVWGGKRAVRRQRQRERRHRVGGSRAYTRMPLGAGARPA
jgi:hypothetical protein